MLQKISPVRHGVVAASVIGMSVLGFAGIIGDGDQSRYRSEHFDEKYVTVVPAGDDHPDGVRVREVIDIDFGVTERRGLQRTIPDDFGAPIDVTVESPDANSELDVRVFGSDVRIRVGNRNITFDGQRRYILEYTLPDAQLSTGQLDLDIIGNAETFDTDRFVIDVIGFDLIDTRCDVGAFGSFGGCDLGMVEAGLFRTVIEDLEPREGITIGGEIAGLAAADFPSVAPLPPRTPTGLRPTGLLQLVVGSALAAGVFALFRRRGGNEVFGGGGAADAAFGSLPVPAPGDHVADVATHRVPDSRLAELATVEFVPPRGIEPWQGNVLLGERVGEEAISAWFSEMIGRGAIEVRGEGSDITLWPGQTTARLSAVDRAHLARIFESSPQVEMGEYDADFSAAWRAIGAEQRRFVSEAGWWDRPPGGGVNGLPSLDAVVRFFVAITLFVSLSLLTAIVAIALGFASGKIVAVLFTTYLVGAVAGLAYWKMLASRTATGSALALRTESFRRFLAASEGKHVQWAWENGVLREYSAWAVALGTADAWSAAIEATDIADRHQFTTPLLLHTQGSAFRSSRVPPPSSGSGGRSSGGGGFSSGGGGGVGGGGGGGSSGSW